MTVPYRLAGDTIGPEEIAAAKEVLDSGFFTMGTRVRQFEGPVGKNIFIGDFFMEPGAASLNVSGWGIENYFESDLWLEKMQANCSTKQLIFPYRKVSFLFCSISTQVTTSAGWVRLQHARPIPRPHGCLPARHACCD